MRFVRRQWKIFAFFFLVHIALLVWRFDCPIRPGDLRVTFLDVGQGDAAVIETPGGAALLIDTGRNDLEGENDSGRKVLAPFLRSRGVNRLAAILLSHPHADHIGGAATLLNLFPVGLLMDNGQDANTPPVASLLMAAQKQGVTYKQARRGQEIALSDGITLKVLAPTEAETQGTANNASMVLRLEYGRTVFLFTGDAEKDEEADLLSSGEPLAAEILKVGHHGSDTSTTPEFLAAVHPRIAVVSVGSHNHFGHPRPEIMERLEASGAKPYRTDRDGAVTCVSDGVNVRCAAFNKEDANR